MINTRARQTCEHCILSDCLSPRCQEKPSGSPGMHSGEPCHCRRKLAMLLGCSAIYHHWNLLFHSSSFWPKLLLMNPGLISHCILFKITLDLLTSTASQPWGEMNTSGSGTKHPQINPTISQHSQMNPRISQILVGWAAPGVGEV